MILLLLLLLFVLLIFFITLALQLCLTTTTRLEEGPLRPGSDAYVSQTPPPPPLKIEYVSQPEIGKPEMRRSEIPLETATEHPLENAIENPR